MLAPHPFGTKITMADLLAQFAQANSWEERYRQLLQLSKLLPVLPDTLKQDIGLISGCENRVWLGGEQQETKWHFYADSDGRIVKGLVAVLLVLIEGKSTTELQELDMLGWFAQLKLDQNLSATRTSGLQALIYRVQQIAVG